MIGTFVGPDAEDQRSRPAPSVAHSRLLCQEYPMDDLGENPFNRMKVRDGEDASEVQTFPSIGAAHMVGRDRMSSL